MSSNRWCELQKGRAKSATVRGEGRMQSHRSGKCQEFFKSRCCELGCLLLAVGFGVPQARAQFSLNRENGARSTVAGSVMIDGDAQPAARVRVDVKPLTGGAIVTTFTDSSGRFEAPAPGSGAGIVAGAEEEVCTGGQRGWCCVLWRRPGG